MNKNSFILTGIEMLGKHTQYPIERIILYMPILLDLAKGMTDKPHRKDDRRGYLTLLSVPAGQILFTIPFGEIPNEKFEKYFELSQEKAMRLYYEINMHLPNGHTTSFQSRDESIDKYGGAIYSNCHIYQHIFSFSGIPELIDEAMMIVLAKQLAKDDGHEIVTEIEALERNPYWKPLAQSFSKYPMMH